MYENVCSFNSSIIIVSKSTLVKVVTYKPWTLTKMSHRINEEIIGVVINIKISIVSQIVEHTEIDEHLEEISENLIVEHLFYTISIATNKNTRDFFPLH